MLGWIKERRRRTIREFPFPHSWLSYLRANVPQYLWLDPADQAKLRDDLRIFESEKYWEGGSGFRLTDEARVTISAMACLLTLHIDNDFYRNVQSIIVYESSYLAPDTDYLPGGAVLESLQHRGGEAHGIGPVILSWSEIRESIEQPGNGRNLVIHEFAHKLDFVDGSADGVPRLYSEDQYAVWADVMSMEYKRLVMSSASGRRTLLDPYGATDSAEFFAVCAETFFEAPIDLESEHPLLFRALKEYFRQDPAERIRAAQ
jgi:Mlc titration factor MtfA (ptsG expression regulator)